MSNYHVELVDKPAALTKEAIKSLRKAQVQGLSRRQLMRTAIGTGIGLWLLEVTAGTLGFAWPNLKGGFGAPIPIGDLDTIKLQNSTLPIEEGFPAYYPEARAFVILYDPGQQRFVAGEDTTGQRRGAQRPRALPALPAPRLQAEPVPQELLVRVPVPRLALRPARHQGRWRPVRARAAEHGPLLDHGRLGRRPDHQHRQDHARPAPGRPRPAGPHPAAHADGLHLMTGSCRPARRGDR